jgi:CheY-like chemotaxis protein
LEESESSGISRGSVFWVELPLAARPEPVARKDGVCSARGGWPQSADLPAGRTMLYIEDNLSNLALIEDLMDRFPDVRLLTAMQGSVGLDLARLYKPDLILLDVHLPKLPGWEVLAQLKAGAATRQIPVVVISADATETQIARMLKAGACTYLTKPVDVRVFLEVVRQVLAGETLSPRAHRM